MYSIMNKYNSHRTLHNYTTVLVLFDSTYQFCIHCVQGAKQGGGVWGVSTPLAFWMGGLNTCQPPLILRKNFQGGGWFPLNLSNYIVYVFLFG